MISEMLDHFLNSTETIDENTKKVNSRIKLIENLVKDLTEKKTLYLYDPCIWIT